MTESREEAEVTAQVSREPSEALLNGLRMVLPPHNRTRPIRNVAPVVRVERGASAQPVAA